MTYKVLKGYLRFYHEKIFYRHTDYIGVENIPGPGTPTLIVSDHQNNMNDPLGIVCAMPDEKVWVFATAAVFGKSGILDSFLHFIGAIPAWRLNFDGEESLHRNRDSFREADRILLDGGKVVIFPEAAHQDKHWLGPFSQGYLRLAFEAAASSGFTKDIQIVPSCNHYSDYYGMRNDLVVKFGEPISLMPYYEQYKTKPRTTLREVNRKVRDAVDDLMLDITDLEHYPEIDFIRNTYGRAYAAGYGHNPDDLNEKLLSDKELISEMESFGLENPEEIRRIYSQVDDIMQEMNALGILHEDLRGIRQTGRMVWECIGLILLMPLAVLALWPSLPMILIPNMIMKKVGDKMFDGTVSFITNAVLLLPLLAVISFVAAGFSCGWLAAGIWVILFPFLFVFEWEYIRRWQNLRGRMKAGRLARRGKLDKLSHIMNDVFEEIDYILSIKGLRGINLK